MARSTPDPVYLLRGSDSPVTALKFLQSKAADETVFASGNLNGCVQLWDLKTYRPIHSFLLDKGKSVLWIDEVYSNGNILTQSRAGNIRLWSRTENGFVETASIPSACLGFCAGCILQHSSNSVLLAVPSPADQSQVDVIDVQCNLLVAQFNPSSLSNKEGMCMAIKPVNKGSDVSQLLIGYESGNVVLWDFKAQTVLDSLKAHKESIMCLDYCDEKNIGISGSTEDVLSTWKVLPGGKIQHDKDIEITNAGVNSIAIRNDRKLFVTAGWDNRVRIFSLKKVRPLAVLTCHTDSVQCLAFSSDNILACGSKDKRISLWDIYK